MSEAKPVVERVARKSGDRICLNGNVGVANARVLRDAALASLATGRKLTVDARQVTWVDPAAAQVLLALQLSCRSRGVALAWQGPPDDVRARLEKYGLGTALASVEAAR